MPGTGSGEAVMGAAGMAAAASAAPVPRTRTAAPNISASSSSWVLLELFWTMLWLALVRVKAWVRQTDCVPGLVEYVVFVGEGNELDPVLELEFCQDAAHVGLHGGLAEHQGRGDLGVSQAFGGQEKYVAFAP